jgi:hypothetical protein
VAIIVARNVLKAECDGVVKAVNPHTMDLERFWAVSGAENPLVCDIELSSCCRCVRRSWGARVVGCCFKHIIIFRFNSEVDVWVGREDLQNVDQAAGR